MVGRERRLSLSLVRQEAIAKAARETARKSTTDSTVGGRETCEAQDKAEDEVRGEKAEGEECTARAGIKDVQIHNAELSWNGFVSILLWIPRQRIPAYVSARVRHSVGARSTCLYGSFVEQQFIRAAFRCTFIVYAPPAQGQVRSATVSVELSGCRGSFSVQHLKVALTSEPKIESNRFSSPPCQPGNHKKLAGSTNYALSKKTKSPAQPHKT